MRIFVVLCAEKMSYLIPENGVRSSAFVDKPVFRVIMLKGLLFLEGSFWSSFRSHVKYKSAFCRELSFED